MPLTAGCTGGGGDGGGDDQHQQGGDDGGTQADTTIEIANTAFRTVRAEVGTGATVTWVNNDGVVHTVTGVQFHQTAESWSFDRRVSAGGSVTHTFESEGIYEYYCIIHGNETMCGAVLVGGTTLDETLPCEESGGGGAY